MTREEQIEKAWVGKYFQSNHRYDEKSFKEGAIWADANPYINWQQVRIQAAIAAMQLIQTDEIFKRWVQERVEEGGVYYEEYPNVAVEIADHLIVALKQEPWILKENDIKL